MITAEQRRAAMLRLATEFEVYAPLILKILPKEGGAPVPFRMNVAQQYLHRAIERQRAETGKVRAIVLKGRQQGISTYTEGRFYWRITHQMGKRAVILTHEQKATDNLFGMVDRYWRNAPPDGRPHLGTSNEKELVFDLLSSRYEVATAGARNTGRGGTAQFFHGCLSPDTSIVCGSTDALVRMGDMQLGDLVRTHLGNVAPITAISRQRKPAVEITMKGLGQLPLVATAEHRFLTPSGWKELREIKPGDVLMFPVRCITDGSIEWGFRSKPETRPQGGGCLPGGPERVVPTYELGRVLGLYLAEGSVSKQSKKPGKPAAVTFSVHEREVARTVAWLRALPENMLRSIKAYPQAGSKTVSVTVYGRSFAEFVLARCGELDGKRLPKEWAECGTDFVQGLVHGYLAGDGHSSTRQYDRRISAPSIRPAITVGMRDALASLGYGWASIGYRDGAIRNGRNERAQWTLRVTGVGVDRLCKEIGWRMPERRRNGDYGAVKVEGGYAYVPVLDMEDAGDVEVMDFEVGHEDHSYCTAHAATHNSEIGFWQFAAQHLAGIGQIVPDAEGTEVIFESTANGTANVFHELWQLAVKGRSDYKPVFIPWFWQPEYAKPAVNLELTGDETDYAETYKLTPEQMAWRRSKIDTDFRGDTGLFDQEYPASAELAFASSSPRALIKAVHVAKARRNRDVEALGPRVMAIDPAEYGDDSTSVMMRQGRVAHRLGRWNGLGTMETVGRASLIADREKPDVIYVDATGVGTGVADRLRELGYPVVRVHFGESPRDVDRYVLCRDEMWGEMAEWFEDGPVSMDDDDDQAAQLTAVQYGYDSKRRIKLEPKEKMKERGLSSPDDADALALTFYRGGSFQKADIMKFRQARGYDD